MDDVKLVLPYMSEYRNLFKVSKIWFMSKTYGVKLQLLKAQIKPSDKRKQNKLDLRVKI